MLQFEIVAVGGQDGLGGRVVVGGVLVVAGVGGRVVVGGVLVVAGVGGRVVVGGALVVAGVGGRVVVGDGANCGQSDWVRPLSVSNPTSSSGPNLSPTIRATEHEV